MNKADKLGIKFKVLCVSHADTGRHYVTELWHNLDNEDVTHYVLGESECNECNCIDGDYNESCEYCNGYGYYEDSYLYMCSLYECTLRQYREMNNTMSHPSHYLSDNCNELCLGDHV